jgi:hypothetical protein
VSNQLAPAGKAIAMSKSLPAARRHTHGDEQTVFDAAALAGMRSSAARACAVAQRPMSTAPSQSLLALARGAGGPANLYNVGGLQELLQSTELAPALPPHLTEGLPA